MWAYPKCSLSHQTPLTPILKRFDFDRQKNTHVRPFSSELKLHAKIIDKNFTVRRTVRHWANKPRMIVIYSLEDLALTVLKSSSYEMIIKSKYVAEIFDLYSLISVKDFEPDSLF